jgi:hypothetical protein
MRKLASEVAADGTTKARMLAATSDEMNRLKVSFLQEGGREGRPLPCEESKSDASGA